MSKKRIYWYCLRDWMGQRSGEIASIALTEEEARTSKVYLYESEYEALRAALS